MLLEVKPIPKLTYKLRLTPQTRLALNLLQLPLTKLKEYIKEEIEKNPVLEPVDSVSALPKERFEASIPGLRERQSGMEMPWPEESEEKRQFKETLIIKQPTLRDHLLRQLQLFARTDNDRGTGEAIIDSISDDGYLRCSIEDIAKSAGTTKLHAEGALSLIQTFDPIGVGARNLRECLLLQIEPTLKQVPAGRIVDKYLPFLEKKRYKYIAGKLKVSVDMVKEAVKEIARLEPKPGRSFCAERALPVVPDVTLRKNKEGYEIVLNDRELPRITINDKYRKLMKQSDTPEDAKEYLRERFRAAESLIHAVKRRRETIQKVIEDIVYAQKDFFDNGGSNFKPMTLEQIAKRIGKHKSTVSRAVNNKFLHTPHGIFELRYFLNSGIEQENGETCSSRNIKDKITELIKKEDKERPLSDRKITSQFRQEGLSVSRRAISKYRGELKILPSGSRRE